MVGSSAPNPRFQNKGASKKLHYYSNQTRAIGQMMTRIRRWGKVKTKQRLVFMATPAKQMMICILTARNAKCKIFVV